MKKEVVEKVQLHSLLMFHYIRSMYPLLQKTSIPQIRYYLMIYFINKSTQNMNFLLQFPHIKATCSKKGSRHMYALHTFCQCLEIWEKISIYPMFEHMPWSFYEKVLWLFWMPEALIEAMKVLKVYDVATTSTLTIVTQTKGFGGTMARNLKGIHVTKFIF